MRGGDGSITQRQIKRNDSLLQGMMGSLEVKATVSFLKRQSSAPVLETELKLSLLFFFSGAIMD